MNKNSILKPQHASYETHRRQFWTQIMMPVLLGALLFFLIPIIVWLLRPGAAGDVGQVSAVATMWLLLPIIILLVILLVVLVGAIYLSARLLTLFPMYSLRAQKFANTAAVETRRAAAMVRKPVLGVRALGRAAQSGFKRLRERA
jgi:hypothetical protein